MKLKRKIGKGKVGMTIDLCIEEQQQLAEWRDALKELSEPKVSNIVVEFDIKHPDVRNLSDEDMDAESKRMDDLLVDAINSVSGLIPFLNNLIDQTPSRAQVIDELTKAHQPDEY